VIAFIRARGLSLAVVVLVMFALTLAQGAVSYTFALGQLRNRLPFDLAHLATAGYLLRQSLVAIMVVLWFLGWKRALFRLVIGVNALAMLMLVAHTGALAGVLSGLGSRAVEDLLLDVVMIAVANILIFSIWYWIIDPPGVEGGKLDGERWAFLFPQRAAELPQFEEWVPRYSDYVFLAFTTSFAFSPTDTLPLTRSAKMLMLVQATISVVTLTGIAGSAINILAGG
jgi:hypothetical protein